jgi:CheY-like chemotaxis protein
MQTSMKALLLSDDPQALTVIDRVLEDFGISTYVYLGGAPIESSAGQRKFDMLLLDFDQPGSMALLDFHSREIWRNPSVVIGMSEQADVLTRVLSKRVHFVLQKPFTEDLLERTIRASYSMIASEKRVAFRHTVQISADARFLEDGPGRPLENSTIGDLSYTGLLLSSPTPKQPGDILSVDFFLPESRERVNAVGKIAWSDADGRCGIEFCYIPPDEQVELRRWLTANCPWDQELERRALSRLQTTQASNAPLRIQ